MTGLNNCIRIGYCSDDILIEPFFVELKEDDTVINVIDKVYEYSNDSIIVCGNETVWKYDSESKRGMDLLKYKDYGLMIYDKNSWKYKKLEKLEKAYKYCLDKMPQYFVKTSLVYINVKINNQNLVALVDTGAQLTIISEKAMELSGLSDGLDARFAVTANGIGGTNNEALGKILNVDLMIEGYILPVVLTVFPDENVGVDMIIGIDTIKCYEGIVDVKNNLVYFCGGKVKTKILDDTQISENIKIFGD